MAVIPGSIASCLTEASTPLTTRKFPGFLVKGFGRSSRATVWLNLDCLLVVSSFSRFKGHPPIRRPLMRRVGPSALLSIAAFSFAGLAALALSAVAQQPGGWTPSLTWPDGRAMEWRATTAPG